MKKLFLIVALACTACSPQSAPNSEVARWEDQAQKVTIIRDDWGIPHIRGGTDA